VDCHCAGLPARVLVAGAPNFKGDSAMELRHAMMKDGDWMRTALITEPRGYPCQNLDVIFPPTPNLPEAAYSYVIAENNFVYPAMSGHNTICVATALLETGMVEMVEPVTEFTLEAPAGAIHITAECENGKAKNITFRNTPSFVGKLGVEVDVPGGVGKVSVDIAYGGMWYAIVDASSIGLELEAENAADIVRLGEMIKVATREQHPVNHPEFDYPGTDIMAFRGPPSAEGVEKYGAHAKNAVVMSTRALDWNDPSTWTGNLDRSPCGSGTSAIMATMYAKGELQLDEPFVHESILGTIFTGRLVGMAAPVGPDKIEAVIPDVTGSAWVTQISDVVIDATDPFPNGYTLGDIW